MVYLLYFETSYSISSTECADSRVIVTYPDNHGDCHAYSIERAIVAYVYLYSQCFVFECAACYGHASRSSALQLQSVTSPTVDTLEGSFDCRDNGGFDDDCNNSEFVMENFNEALSKILFELSF